MLCNGGIDSFVDALNGHNPTWSRQVADSWDEGRVQVDGRHFSISLEFIEATMGMANLGRRYSIYTRTSISEVQLFYGQCVPLPETRKSTYPIASI